MEVPDAACIKQACFQLYVINWSLYMNQTPEPSTEAAA